MKSKKTKKADLEGYRGIFLQVGLLLALIITYVGLNWKTEVVTSMETIELTDASVIEEKVQITVQEKKKLPPLPKQKRLAVLKIVDSDDLDDSDLEIEDAMAEENDSVEIIPVEEDVEEGGESQVFVKVEKMPEFPGGIKALMKFLHKHMRYPTIALENGIQGTVYVGFVVSETGKVIDVKLLRGVDPYLDKEALRVVAMIPDWKPGLQFNRAVRVYRTVPVTFRLK